MSSKIDDLLYFSMNADDSTREASNELKAGYDNINKTWETIVKLSGSKGSLDILREKYPAADITELINGYGIIRANKTDLLNISEEPYINYMEISKNLYLDLYYSKVVSCITPMSFMDRTFGLSGMGVYVAILDTGINIYSKEFIKSDGTTRLAYFYDQVEKKEYLKEDINALLRARVDIRFTDTNGHGTYVADIAAGNSGVAFDSEIIAVKLGFSEGGSFPRTAQVMEAVNYSIEKAIRDSKPVAINISFGTNYGDHSGNGILEQFLNSAIGVAPCAICIGTGNEGQGRTHQDIRLSKKGEQKVVELVVSENESSMDLQIWKNFNGNVEITLVAPNGEETLVVRSSVNDGRTDISKYTFEKTDVAVFLGQPSPFNMNQEIYMSFQGRRDENIININSGIWTLIIKNLDEIEADIHMWLPAQISMNPQSGFLRPSPDNTFTIPSTARNVISVGAYDAVGGGIAAFSGRGNVTDGLFKVVKPEIVAPGVGIRLPEGLTYGSTFANVVSGTSFSTPFVCGVTALLMEWGIVRGNDVNLYGEKLKARIIRGAVSPTESTESKMPSNDWGYGKLCGYNSLIL